MLENSPGQRKYYEQVDVLRGFAIMLVILGHAVAKENIVTSGNVFCNTLYNYIYSFHMPLFFVISGFVFSVKDNFKEHVIRIVRSLLIPYVVFNLFTIFLQQILPFFTVEGRSVAQQVKTMVLNGGNLWYIYVLIEFRLLFYVIHKIMDRNIKRGVILFLLFFITASLTLPDFKYFLFSSFVSYAPFFMLGYFVRVIVGQKEIKISKRRKTELGILFFIMHLLLFVCKTYFKDKFLAHYPLYFLLAIAGCIASGMIADLIFCGKLKKAFAAFGKNSFQMYIFNGYFISISRTLLAAVFQMNAVWILAIMNFIMGLIPNYIFSDLLMKIKPVRMIFGKDK